MENPSAFAPGQWLVFDFDGKTWTEYEHVQTITNVREGTLQTVKLGCVRVVTVTTSKLPGDDLPAEHHFSIPLAEQDWSDTDGRAHKLLMRWDESGPIGLVSRTDDFLLDEWQLELMGKVLPTWTASWLALQTVIESTVVVENRGYWENITGIIELVECDQCISAAAFVYPHETPSSDIRYFDNFSSEYVRRVVLFCPEHLPPGDLVNVPQQFEFPNPSGDPEHTNFGHLPDHIRFITGAYLDRSLARHGRAVAGRKPHNRHETGNNGVEITEQRGSVGFDF